MEMLDNRIFLSIAIPTYNRAVSLQKLLNNILPQIKEAGENIEICISDNDSSDNTHEVITGFKEKYPNLINYKKNEKNLGAERNILKLIEMSQGDFVWLFSDDDLIIPTGLKEVANFIKKNCNEDTALISLRNESYFIDEKTGKRIIYCSSFEPDKSEVLELSRKNIIEADFPDSAAISVLIFNSIFLKKILKQDEDLIKRAVGSGYIHVFIYRLMFLKFSEIRGKIFNKTIVLQELPKYKSYIEGVFRHHYVGKKKISGLLLSSGYADKTIKTAFLQEDKEARKNIIQDIIMKKTFCSFNYSSFAGMLKLFFNEATFQDAMIFSFVFLVMFFMPSFILKIFLKIYFFIKYNQDWKRHWIFCETIHFKASQGPEIGSITNKLKIKINESIKKIWEAEKQFDLFSYKCCNIPIWIYPRIKAINMIDGVNDFEVQTEAFIKMNFFNVLGRIFCFFAKMPYFFGNDVIIFSNERYLDLDKKSGKYFNSMAEAAILDSRAKKPLIFEFPSFTTKKYKKTRYNNYTPLDFFLLLNKMFSFLSFGYTWKIRKEFFSELTSSGLWTDSQVRELIKFTSHCAYNINSYNFFLQIIKFLNPKAKLIYSCVAGYDKFFDAVEIQHGLIVDSHAQLFFPQVDSVKEYVKNKKTIVFSERAKTMCLSHGYTDKNTVILPNPKVSVYFSSNIDKQFFESQKKSNENNVVMIGSLGNVPNILKKMILDIEKNKERFEDWNFSLIMHPSEKNTYKGMMLQKVEIFENHQASLWDLLANSLCVVVVASSVIEEATYFGCFEAIILDETMEDQKDYIKALAGNYPFKEVVRPEEFLDWFKKNKQKIIMHRNAKIKIMEKNHHHFQNYNKSRKNQK